MTFVQFQGKVPSGLKLSLKSIRTVRRKILMMVVSSIVRSAKDGVE